METTCTQWQRQAEEPGGQRWQLIIIGLPLLCPSFHIPSRGMAWQTVNAGWLLLHCKCSRPVYALYINEIISPVIVIWMLCSRSNQASPGRSRRQGNIQDMSITEPMMSLNIPFYFSYTFKRSLEKVEFILTSTFLYQLSSGASQVNPTTAWDQLTNTVNERQLKACPYKMLFKWHLKVFNPQTDILSVCSRACASEVSFETEICQQTEACLKGQGLRVVHEINVQGQKIWEKKILISLIFYF